MIARLASAERSGSFSPLKSTRAARISFSSSSSSFACQPGGNEPALARLAQPVEPFALVSVGKRLLVPERPQLVAAEEVGVARDDRGLLPPLFLTHARRPPLSGPLVEIPLELFLELSGTAHRSGRHLEYSIQPREGPAAQACRGCRST